MDVVVSIFVYFIVSLALNLKKRNVFISNASILFIHFGIIPDSHALYKTLMISPMSKISTNTKQHKAKHNS